MGRGRSGSTQEKESEKSALDQRKKSGGFSGPSTGSEGCGPRGSLCTERITFISRPLALYSREWCRIAINFFLSPCHPILGARRWSLCTVKKKMRERAKEKEWNERLRCGIYSLLCGGDFLSLVLVNTQTYTYAESPIHIYVSHVYNLCICVCICITKRVACFIHAVGQSTLVFRSVPFLFGSVLSRNDPGVRTTRFLYTLRSICFLFSAYITCIYIWTVKRGLVGKG